MNAIKQFFITNQKSWSLLIARLALGFVILPHGMQKALGMFGGKGFEATIEGFNHYMGLPVIIAVLVILAEFAGSIGIILGLGTRFMASSLCISMTGAMILGGHIYNGFFMNWTGTQKGEGIEFFVLVLGLALALVIGGSGKFSFDNLIFNKLK